MDGERYRGPKLAAATISSTVKSAAAISIDGTVKRRTRVVWRNGLKERFEEIGRRMKRGKKE